VFENSLFQNISFDNSNTVLAVFGLCAILEPGGADMRTVTHDKGKHKKAWPFR
jgi:hypothetical protein